MKATFNTLCTTLLAVCTLLLSACGNGPEPGQEETPPPAPETRVTGPMPCGTYTIWSSKVGQYVTITNPCPKTE